MACYGRRYYETPHLDRLAAGGIRFTSGYTCGPNCQPTRAALITGQCGPRTGVYTVGSIDRFNWRSRPLRPVDNVAKLPLQKVTLAQVLKQAGYVTGLFGKRPSGEIERGRPANRHSAQTRRASVAWAQTGRAAGASELFRARTGRR